jgi:hypothetical protein
MKLESKLEQHKNILDCECGIWLSGIDILHSEKAILEYKIAPICFGFKKMDFLFIF